MYLQKKILYPTKIMKVTQQRHCSQKNYTQVNWIFFLAVIVKVFINISAVLLCGVYLLDGI